MVRNCNIYGRLFSLPSNNSKEKKMNLTVLKTITDKEIFRVRLINHLGKSIPDFYRGASVFCALLRQFSQVLRQRTRFPL